MAQTAARRRSSFRDRVSQNSQAQRNKSANYGHLTLPRGVNVFKEEPGSRASLDILPYIVTDDKHPDLDTDTGSAAKGELWYRRPYKLHRNIGAENTSLVCPTSFGRKCPICEYRANLLNEGTKWDDDAVKALRPSDRNLYYVVPLGVKKFENKPHIWDISQFLFQNKLNEELEEDDERCDFPDLEAGLTLKIRFSEEKFANNSYADTSRIDFERRDHAYKMADVEKLSSLDEVLIVKSYKEIQDIFLDQGAEEEEEEEQPKRQRSSERSARPARSQEPEEEEPEEEEPEEEEPEEEEPEEEEPEEEEPEEEEPEEEEPQPKNRRAAPAAPSAPQSRRNTVPAQAATAPKRATTPAQSARRERPSTENKCPSGHRFGKDNDKKPECEECKIWNECMDAAEAA